MSEAWRSAETSKGYRVRHQNAEHVWRRHETAAETPRRARGRFWGAEDAPKLRQALLRVESAARAIDRARRVRIGRLAEKGGYNGARDGSRPLYRSLRWPRTLQSCGKKKHGRAKAWGERGTGCWFVPLLCVCFFPSTPPLPQLGACTRRWLEGSEQRRN